MSKQRGDSPSQQNQAFPPPQRGVDAVGFITLVGVVATLAISLSNWREIDQIHDSLDKLETSVAEAPRQAAPQQAAAGGLDPNRVYTIKTAGGPFRGATDAPVTIAEFSDFQ